MHLERCTFIDSGLGLTDCRSILRDNTFIRTSGAFDGVIDFEAATRDPAAPTKFKADLQMGDNLHPNAAGYEAMAAAVDLGLFVVK